VLFSFAVILAIDAGGPYLQVNELYDIAKLGANLRLPVKSATRLGPESSAVFLKHAGSYFQVDG
jgi:hypothetical protein